MAEDSDLDVLYDSIVYDENGDKIGRVGQVYLSETDGSPSWVTVKTGLFGSNETFIPLDDARLEGEAINVPYSKRQVHDAPHLEADQDLSKDEEQRLYEYYGLRTSGSEAVGNDAGPDRSGDGRREHDADADRPAPFDGRDYADEQAPDDAARDHSGNAPSDRGPDDVFADRPESELAVPAPLAAAEFAEQRPADDEPIDVDGPPADQPRDVGSPADLKDGDADGTLVRHAERLHVGTERVASEAIRVTKRIVTETKTVEVEIRREELVIDRRPVESGAASEKELGDDEAVPTDDITITLYEERPVVTTETYPVEEIVIGKRSMRSTETVSGDVSHEEIDIDGPDGR